MKVTHNLEEMSTENQKIEAKSYKNIHFFNKMLTNSKNMLKLYVENMYKHITIQLTRQTSTVRVCPNRPLSAVFFINFFTT